jgi:hypothetical protein
MFVPQAMSRYYLYAAVAPSPRSPRPWDDQQVARAQRFARSFSSEQWTSEPLTADQDITCLQRNGLAEMEWDSNTAQRRRAIDAPIGHSIAASVPNRERQRATGKQL